MAIFSYASLDEPWQEIFKIKQPERLVIPALLIICFGGFCYLLCYSYCLLPHKRGLVNRLPTCFSAARREIIFLDSIISHQIRRWKTFASITERFPWKSLPKSGKHLRECKRSLILDTHADTRIKNYTGKLRARIFNGAADDSPAPCVKGRVERGRANQFCQRRRSEIFVAREFNFFKAPSERHHLEFDGASVPASQK